MIKISIQSISRPLNQVFSIARGSKSTAVNLVVELDLNGVKGRGEATPYARYGETIESASDVLLELKELDLESEPMALLPAGAARNALDCALWDLKAKSSSKSIETLLGLAPPSAVMTAQTLSLDTPEAMAEAAKRLSDDALIKIKLGGEGDLERLSAIRDVRPKARLIVDANEGWNVADYEEFVPEFEGLGVKMIEQPFPAEADEALISLERPIAICADESAHTSDDISYLATRYDIVNIKLDKTGGLTEAVKMKKAAQDSGLGVMIGCMVGSSLSMAPAYYLTQDVDYVDLDGPLFLRQDEEPAIIYKEGVMYAPSRDLWG